MGLLHYYDDGFIWKVREVQTRESLDLQPARTDPRVAYHTTWLAHSAKWSLFAVPLALFAFSQWQAGASELSRLASLATSLPQDAAVQFDYGRALERSGSRRLAANQYRRTVGIVSDSAGAHLRLGILLRSQGELASSQRHLMRTIELMPQDAAARIHLSRTLVARDRLTEAETQLQYAVKLAPTSKQARTNLGIVLVLAKNYAAAATQFRQVLRDHPADANAHLNLGNVLLEQSKLREASHHFRRASELNPQLVEAARQLRRMPAES